MALPSSILFMHGYNPVQPAFAAHPIRKCAQQLSWLIHPPNSSGPALRRLAVSSRPSDRVSINTRGPSAKSVDSLSRLHKVSDASMPCGRGSAGCNPSVRSRSPVVNMKGVDI